MDAGTPPQIRYDHVTVAYNEEVTALRNISLSIQRGEFAFFVGKTGAGKSTMLKLLWREVRETGGNVFFEGKRLADIRDMQIPALRRQMGVVPQDFALLPRKKVWENIGYAMRAVGFTRREIRNRIPDILEQVRIAHRADAYPHELSGGEQQRVAIGRSLVASPKLVLADEPTGNLDPEHSWEIMEVLLNLNRQGTTILVASHDMVVVERVGKRIITFESGEIVSDVTPETCDVASGLQPQLEFAEHHAVVEVEEREEAVVDV